jgi:hypothetical protein
MTMKRGDGRDITCRVTMLGNSISLSGYTIWFGAKSQLSLTDGAADILKISTTSGHMTVDGNLVTVHIQPGDTTHLPSRTVRLHYEWQVKSPGGVAQTIDSGILTVEPDVVRAI